MALLYSLLFFDKFRDKLANSLNKCIIIEKKKEERKEGRGKKRKQRQQAVPLPEVTTTGGEARIPTQRPGFAPHSTRLPG